MASSEPVNPLAEYMGVPVYIDETLDPGTMEMRSPSPSHMYAVVDSLETVKRVIEAGNQFQPCIRCGTPMGAIRGTKDAICQECGWKDDCC